MAASAAATITRRETVAAWLTHTVRPRVGERTASHAVPHRCANPLDPEKGEALRPNRKKARVTTLQQVSDHKGAPHPKADAAVLSGIFAAAGRHRIEIAGARLPMKMELAE